jgi:hypothetical protein
VVEGARLESVYRGNSIEGSNPSLSAIIKSVTYNGSLEFAGKIGQALILQHIRTWPGSVAEEKVKVPEAIAAQERSEPSFEQGREEGCE